MVSSESHLKSHTGNIALSTDLNSDSSTKIHTYYTVQQRYTKYSTHIHPNKNSYKKIPISVTENISSMSIW